MVMKQSLNSGTLDNISCIFICFSNFKRTIQSKFGYGNDNSKDKEKEKDFKENFNKSQAFNVKNEYGEYGFEH